MSTAVQIIGGVLRSCAPSPLRVRLAGRERMAAFVVVALARGPVVCS